MVPNVPLPCTLEVRAADREMNKNIYLVGPMGSGKSTVGQRLAKRLGLEFHDCDQEIQERTGVSINLIFDIEGESGFRKREALMLRELADRDGVLVATGGGVVLSEGNRRLLKDTGVVIYLKASVFQQLERLRLDKSRPLLKSDNRAETLQALADVRNPLYEELADLVFPVRNRSVDSTVSQIVEALEARHSDSTRSHG